MKEIQGRNLRKKPEGWNHGRNLLSLSLCLWLMVNYILIEPEPYSLDMSQPTMGCSCHINHLQGRISQILAWGQSHGDKSSVPSSQVTLALCLIETKTNQDIFELDSNDFTVFSLCIVGKGTKIYLRDLATTILQQSLNYLNELNFAWGYFLSLHIHLWVDINIVHIYLSSQL